MLHKRHFCAAEFIPVCSRSPTGGQEEHRDTKLRWRELADSRLNYRMAKSRQSARLSQSCHMRNLGPPKWASFSTSTRACASWGL